jgi:hypothetical protein
MVEEDNFPSGLCPQCGRVPLNTIEIVGMGPGAEPPGPFLLERAG